MTSRVVIAFVVRYKRESPKSRTEVGLRKVYVGGIEYCGVNLFSSFNCRESSFICGL
jgi:hypothetical protein